MKKDDKKENNDIRSERGRERKHTDTLNKCIVNVSKVRGLFIQVVVVVMNT